MHAAYSIVEIEDELVLPAFSNTTELLNFVTDLAVLRYPTWFRAFTICVSSLMLAFIVAGWGIFLWRSVSKQLSE